MRHNIPVCYPRWSQILTVKQFLGLTPQQRAYIRESRIIAPQYSPDHSRLRFGGVEVVWRYPFIQI